jgi:glycosyltransferase involved in cell wall biosynthesis
MSRRTFALTVVTPCWNAAAHITKCLDSVRAQNRDDVEHLIVDGGSTDGTTEIVSERMAVDSRVRLIGGPDRGQANAMNKGVISAQGDIIGCLNADDRYHAGALAAAIDGLAHAPVPSFLWGECQVEDGLTNTVWTQRPGEFQTWRMMLGWGFEPHPVNPCAYFYHRALHFTAGLYDESDHYALDVDFLLRVALHAKSTVVVNQLLGTYVLAPGTKTFEDTTSGQSAERIKGVFARYLPNLTGADRVRYEAARARQSLRQSRAART